MIITFWACFACKTARVTVISETEQLLTCMGSIPGSHGLSHPHTGCSSCLMSDCTELIFSFFIRCILMVIAGMSIVAVGLVALCNLYAVISNAPHTQNHSSVKVYRVREVWSQEVFQVIGWVNPTLCHGKVCEEYTTY